MNRILSFTVFCLFFAVVSPQTIWAEELVHPELKPLDKFVGSWKTEVEGADMTGKANAEWILDGRFLQQKYSLSDGTKGMILRSYDPNTQKHIMYTFDSKGTMLQQKGSWDEATNTLTVRGEVGDVVVVTKAHFPNNDTEEWVVIVQDDDGNELQALKGKNVRTAR